MAGPTFKSVDDYVAGVKKDNDEPTFSGVNKAIGADSPTFRGIDEIIVKRKKEAPESVWQPPSFTENERATENLPDIDLPGLPPFADPRKGLRSMEWWKIAEHEWKSGEIAEETGRAYSDIWYGEGTLETAKQKRMAAYDRLKKMGKSPTPDWNDSKLKNLWGAGVNMMPFMLKASLAGGEWAMKGGIAGGGAALVGGPATAPMAPATFVTGMVAGAKYGVIKYSMDVEGGNIMGDLVDAGVDPTLASLAGQGGGLAIGVIETFQLQRFGKLYKGNRILKNLLKNKGISSVMFNTVRQLAGVYGHEVTEEGAQKIVEISTKALTKYIDGDFGYGRQSKKNLLDYFKREYAQSGTKEELIQAAKGMVLPTLLGLPTAGISNARAAYEYGDLKANETEVFHSKVGTKTGLAFALQSHYADLLAEVPGSIDYNPAKGFIDAQGNVVPKDKLTEKQKEVVDIDNMSLTDLADKYGISIIEPVETVLDVDLTKKLVPGKAVAGKKVSNARLEVENKKGYTEIDDYQLDIPDERKAVATTRAREVLDSIDDPTIGKLDSYGNFVRDKIVAIVDEGVEAGSSNEQITEAVVSELQNNPTIEWRGGQEEVTGPDMIAQLIKTPMSLRELVYEVEREVRRTGKSIDDFTFVAVQVPGQSRKAQAIKATLKRLAKGKTPALNLYPVGPEIAEKMNKLTDLGFDETTSLGLVTGELSPQIAVERQTEGMEPTCRHALREKAARVAEVEKILEPGEKVVVKQKLKDMTTRKLNNLRRKVEQYVHPKNGIVYTKEKLTDEVAAGVSESGKIVINLNELIRQFDKYKKGEKIFNKAQELAPGLQFHEFLQFAIEHEKCHIATGIDGEALDENVCNKIALERIKRDDLAERIIVPFDPTIQPEADLPAVPEDEMGSDTTGQDEADRTEEKVRDTTKSGEQVSQEKANEKERNAKARELDVPPDGQETNWQEIRDIGGIEYIYKLFESQGIDVEGRTPSELVEEHPEMIAVLKDNPALMKWFTVEDAKRKKGRSAEAIGDDYGIKDTEGLNQAPNVNDDYKVKAWDLFRRWQSTIEMIYDDVRALSTYKYGSRLSMPYVEQKILQLQAQLQDAQQQKQALQQKAQVIFADPNLAERYKLEEQDKMVRLNQQISYRIGALQGVPGKNEGYIKNLARLKVKLQKMLDAKQDMAEKLQTYYKDQKQKMIDEAPADIQGEVIDAIGKVGEIDEDSLRRAFEGQWDPRSKRKSKNPVQGFVWEEGMWDKEDAIEEGMGGLKSPLIPAVDDRDAPTENLANTSKIHRLKLVIGTIRSAIGRFDAEPIDYLMKWFGKDAVSRSKRQISRLDILTYAQPIYEVKRMQERNGAFAGKVVHDVFTTTINDEVKRLGLKGVLKDIHRDYLQFMTTRAGEDIGTNGKTSSTFWPSDWGRAGGFSTQEQGYAYAYLRAIEEIWSTHRRPLDSTNKVKPHFKKEVDDIIASNPQWQQNRDLMYYFKKLPISLQDAVVFWKCDFETPMRDASIDAGMWDSADIYRREQAGYTRRQAKLPEDQLQEGGYQRGMASEMQRQNYTPQREQDSWEEFYLSTSNSDMSPILNMSALAREYLFEGYQRLGYQALQDKFKRMPNPEDVNYDIVEFTHSIIRKLGLKDDPQKGTAAEQAEAHLSNKLHYMKIHEAPGFAEWHRGSFKSPFVHKDVYKLIDAICSARRKGNWTSLWLGMNQLAKRSIMLTPHMFAVQIASTPFVWQTVYGTGALATGKFKKSFEHYKNAWKTIAPLIPFGTLTQKERRAEIKTFKQGLMSAIPELYTRGLSLGTRIRRGAVDPGEHFRNQGFNSHKLSLFAKHGMSSFSFDVAMANLFEKNMTSKDPMDRADMENITEWLGGKFGIDQYTFNYYIAGRMYELTDLFFEDFKNKGWDEDTAARRACQLVGDITGMVNSSIYGNEGKFLQSVLFARDFTTTFFRQVSGATAPLWSNRLIKGHGYKFGKAGATNWFFHADKSHADLAALTPYYVAHLSKVIFAKMMWMNMMQFGLMMMFGDEEEKKRPFAFQNIGARKLVIKIPRRLAEGMGGLFNVIYVDLLGFRETNNLADLLETAVTIASGGKVKLGYGRGMAELLRSKSNVGISLLMGVMMRMTPIGKMISPDLEAIGFGELVKNWAKWGLFLGMTTPFKDDVKRLPWDYFSQFLALPIKVGEPYEKGQDYRDLQHQRALQEMEAWERQELQRKTKNMTPEQMRELVGKPGGYKDMKAYLNAVRLKRRGISVPLRKGRREKRRLERKYPNIKKPQ